MAEAKTEEWAFTAYDRCDAKDCGAQAYVKASGVTGELLFCAHHYENIVNNALGYDKMMKFAFKVEDERSRLIENRLKVEN